MSLLSSSVFVHLHELKLWQKQNSLENSDLNITPTSPKDSLNQSPKVLDWDKIEIPQIKPFEELLEEKLKIEESEPQTPVKKSKKPFLKKGAGLRRFQLSSNSKPKNAVKTEQKKSKTKTEPNRKISTIEHTPLKMPDFVMQSKDHSKEENKWVDPSFDSFENETKEMEGSESLSRNRIVEVDSVKRTDKGTPSDQTLFERELERELKIFEQLEEKVNNSSFCSSDSSILRLLTSSTPNKLDSTVYDEDDHGDFNNTDPKLKLTIEDFCENNDMFNLFLTKLKALKADNESSQDKTLRKDEESDTGSEVSTYYEVPASRNAACNTSFSESSQTLSYCPNCSELQKQLETYKMELNNLKREKEELLYNFKQEEMMKERLMLQLNEVKIQYDDEITILKSKIEEDKLKMAKDKALFDSYVKDIQNKPNRKDREEISNLKKELSNVKELMKLKDTKNGTSQARMRTQLKQLEKENVELKNEVQKLTKECSKLSAKQKLNRPDSKILMQIQKNVSKLAESKKSSENTKVTKSILKNSMDARSEHSASNETNLDMTDFVDLERRYDTVFKQLPAMSPSNTSSASNDSKKHIVSEKTLEDGSKELLYANGNKKVISDDGNITTVNYYNGDVKKIFKREKMQKYFYKANGTWHTQFENGSEVLEFANGQVEKKSSDGTCEVFYPDGVVQVMKPDGSEEATYPDGSVLKIDNKTNTRILLLANGQKEVHTKENKRREYPDGTVKILYPDGTQETRYANGRVRMKSAQGVLIMDSHSPILETC